MKKRIEDMGHKFSDTQTYLYGFGVLLFIERVFKSALLWLWDHLNYVLIVGVLFCAGLTAAGLEADAISVAMALILFITQFILSIVLIKGIVTERKLKSVEEKPKVVVQNVQTMSRVSDVPEPQSNVPVHLF